MRCVIVIYFLERAKKSIIVIYFNMRWTQAESLMCHALYKIPNLLFLLLFLTSINVYLAVINSTCNIHFRQFILNLRFTQFAPKNRNLVSLRVPERSYNILEEQSQPLMDPTHRVYTNSLDPHESQIIASKSPSSDSSQKSA